MDDFTSYLAEIDRQRESEPPFSEWHEAWRALSPEEKEAVKKEIGEFLERLERMNYEEERGDEAF